MTHQLGNSSNFQRGAGRGTQSSHRTVMLAVEVGYVESGCGTSGRGTGRWGCDLPARCVELMNDDVCVEDSRERDDCIVSGVHTLFGEIQH